MKQKFIFLAYPKLQIGYSVGALKESELYRRGMVRHIFIFKIHYFQRDFFRNDTKTAVIIQIRLVRNVKK